MALSEEQIAVRRRNADIRRAYGCRHEHAWEIAKGESGFARAVRHFGPMFCWYRKETYQWTLFGEPKSKKEIVAAAGLPTGLYGRRRWRNMRRVK